MKLNEIAQALGGTVHGDPNLEVDSAVHPKDSRSPRDLALAMNAELLECLKDCPARAAIVSDGAEIPAGSVDGYVSVGRSRYAMAGLTRVFERPVHAESGIHSSAVVAPDARIGDICLRRRRRFRRSGHDHHAARHRWCRSCDRRELPFASGGENRRESGVGGSRDCSSECEYWR